MDKYTAQDILKSTLNGRSFFNVYTATCVSSCNKSDTVYECKIDRTDALILTRQPKRWDEFPELPWKEVDCPDDYFAHAFKDAIRFNDLRSVGWYEINDTRLMGWLTEWWWACTNPDELKGNLFGDIEWFA